ncbi:MAG: hypothetical protein QF704_10145 [Anaerolineales bacterium]|jgi:hypothetical protein|nr:hypothetical protein [Anaerolineales bacterium]
MGNVSVNKLGGLSLIIGPWLALVFYFLQPGGPFIDTADPANAAATIAAIVGNSGLGQIVSVVIPIGLLILLYGISVFQGTLRNNGNGDALARYGMMLITFGIIGWTIGSGLNLAIAGAAAEQAPAFGTIYGASQGVGTVSGILAGLGFTALALGVSTRDDYNKIFALAAVAAGIVAVVVTIIGGIDSAQLQTMGNINGICYVVHSLWVLTIGLDLLKKD